MDEPKLTVKLKPMVDARHWMVLEPISYGGVDVPAGFVTDLASIPLGARWVFPHGGAKAFGAVVHDFSYRNGLYTKRIVDGIFETALRENGVPEWKITTMVTAVKWFGHKAYKGT